MKPRFILWTVTLAAAILAVSCAPAAPTETAPPLAQPTSTLAATLVVEPALPTAEASVPTVLPVATSRGPNLEATDPATVSLASGGLQLVEFFRFT